MLKYSSLEVPVQIRKSGVRVLKSEGRYVYVDYPVRLIQKLRNEWAVC